MVFRVQRTCQEPAKEQPTSEASAKEAGALRSGSWWWVSGLGFMVKVGRAIQKHRGRAWGPQGHAHNTRPILVLNMRRPAPLRLSRV